MLGFEHKISPVEATLPRLLGCGRPGRPSRAKPPKVHFSAGLFPTASASVHLSSDRAQFAPLWRFLLVRMNATQPRKQRQGGGQCPQKVCAFFPPPGWWEISTFLSSPFSPSSSHHSLLQIIPRRPRRPQPPALPLTLSLFGRHHRTTSTLHRST
jgi:hypothetical protein